MDYIIGILDTGNIEHFMMVTFYKRCLIVYNGILVDVMGRIAKFIDTDTFKDAKIWIDTDDDVLGGFDLKEFVLLNFYIIKEDATYFLQIFPEEGIYRNE